MKKFVRIISLVLAIVSLMAVAMPALAAKTPFSGVGYITSANGGAVNVRTGPGINYSLAAIKTMAVGTQVTLQYRDTDANGVYWFQVVNSANKGGWVRTDFLTAKSPQQTWEIRYGDRTYSRSTTAYELFKNVQRDLNAYYELNGLTDYAVYPLTVDGKFGPGTEVAVVTFQQREFPNHSDRDGIVGPKTKAKLFSCTH